MVILFNKPFGVLTQFTDKEERETLSDYIKVPNVYPAGRLDKDSEGLVVLTDDPVLRHKIMHPKFKLEKTYWVQVEGVPPSPALNKLTTGVLLNDGVTKPAKIKIIEPPSIWERHPPIRFRATIPTTWLEIKLKEGRNRQIRRMTAAVGFPTLRIVRVAIGEWQLSDLQPGQWRCS
ncbi:MAG: pseudouridine synthase [Gammaproteobacteria bacterium]|nr:pseudouridine synthase [Gammaproteobacteria bacterium]